MAIVTKTSQSQVLFDHRSVAVVVVVGCDGAQQQQHVSFNHFIFFCLTNNIRMRIRGRFVVYRFCFDFNIRCFIILFVWDERKKPIDGCFSLSHLQLSIELIIPLFTLTDSVRKSEI